MTGFPVVKNIGDKLISLICNHFKKDGLSPEEATALNNILFEHGVTVIQDTITRKSIKLGVTSRAIADIAAYLTNRYFERKPPSETGPFAEGARPEHFLFKYSEDFVLVAGLRERLLENPYIEKIEPQGSGIYNLTDKESTNY
jgi:hypothetical protein